MAKQPEQILEEQLVAQSKGSRFGVLNLFKSLKSNAIKNLILKMFTEFKKGITFESTVPLLLPVEQLTGRSSSKVFLLTIIHLLCLSTMHT